MKFDDVVFLSASVPYRPPWNQEAQPLEIEQAIVSIARAVFARQGRLLFGGHPSISPLVADIAGEYYAADRRRTVRPIVTFQSEFYKDKLPQKTWDLYTMGWSEIEWTPEGKDRDESLDIMRSAMLALDDRGREAVKRNELRPVVAMFAVGGMEGIRDEAAMFLQANRARPVFLLKTPGAAAASLTESPEQWRERLWPTDEFRPTIFQALLDGERGGRMIDLERRWEQELTLRKVDLPRFEVQPYGTMVQWVLDEVLHD
jgi:hypothetical protein